jgi:hypothetical protein
MGQSYLPIQQALDTRLATVSGIYGSGSNQNLIAENATFNLASIADPTGKVFVRSTLAPIKPQTETIGVNGYDKIAGFYVVDVFGPLDEGYTAVKTMADLIIAAFPRGANLSLSNGNQITVETAGMTPLPQGGWDTSKWYAVQVRIDWFGYMQP